MEFTRLRLGQQIQRPVESTLKQCVLEITISDVHQPGMKQRVNT